MHIFPPAIPSNGHPSVLIQLDLAMETRCAGGLSSLVKAVNLPLEAS